VTVMSGQGRIARAKDRGGARGDAINRAAREAFGSRAERKAALAEARAAKARAVRGRGRGR
jgi:hypothetical protein